MNTPKDGGPAFARPAFTPAGWHVNAAQSGFANIATEGMSVRQVYKSVIALGLYACPVNPHGKRLTDFPDLAAEHADRMLAEDAEHARKEQK